MTELNAISLRKNDLGTIHIFLVSAELKGVASRARTKLDKLISDNLNDLISDEKELAKDHSGTIQDNGNVSFNSETSDRDDFDVEHKQLLDEKVSLIEHTEGYFEKLTTALNDLTKDLNGLDAQAYDTLLDALEAEKAEG